MKKDSILRLVIVEDSSNDAEAIINVLRRVGHSVRAVRVATKEKLQAALSEQMQDIIICAKKSAAITAMQAFSLVKNSGKDISFIVLGASHDDPGVLEVLQAGARDVVMKDHPEHLQLVVARELSDLETRRNYRASLKAYRDSEKRCHSLIDSSRDAISYVHDGMHIYANSVYLNMFGYQTPEEIDGMPIMDMVAPSHHAPLKEFLRNYNKGETQTTELELKGVRTDNSEFEARMVFSPATIDGEACTQIIMQDLSQYQEWEQKLKSLSKQDLLTGLANRQHFLEELEAGIAQAGSGAANSALLYIELDNLKDIKEKVGIGASDLVISDIANLLRGQVNESDLLARFSDDTFTVLLPNKDVDYAQAAAQIIVKTVRDNLYDAAGQSITTSCSVSIGLITEYVLSSKELLSQMSKTCAEIRSKGGNAVYLHCSDSEDRTAKQKLQEAIKQIQGALEHNRFRLVFQPIVSLHGMLSENYQVLLRMLDEQGVEVAPQAFMPIAEQVGLATAVDRWVINTAIGVLSTKRRAGSKLSFFIKLAGDSLKDESLLLWVSERLKAARLEGDSITFEVNEPAAMSRLKYTQAFIKGAKELRCRFALDHFGCDPDSLSYLKRMPLGIEYLKIDGSFLIDLASNAERQNAVKEINETAHAMGIMTIAECVQDAGSLAVLWQYGVNYVQGYYLQKPSEMLNYDFAGEG